MIFLDTNVVVPALATSHPNHSLAKNFVLSQLELSATFVISPQVVGETFRVLTSPKLVSKPFSPGRLLKVTMDFLDGSPVRVLSPGKQAIEVALVTAAQREITRIATFNEKDFRNLEGIELVPIP